MTSPDGVWIDLASRAHGFVVGFCLGDALASSPGGPDGPLLSSNLSRVFLNAALALDWVILCDQNLLDRRAADMPQDRDSCAGMEGGDIVLARSLPTALAVITRCPQALPHLSLVNAGWLGLLVDRCNQPHANVLDVALARAVVRNATRRLLAETTDRFGTPEHLDLRAPWHPGDRDTPAHRLIVQLDAQCSSGDLGDLSNYGEPAHITQTVAEALALLAALESGAQTVQGISTHVERPSVAALALALHGAAHGIGAFPSSALADLDVAPITERIARSIIQSARTPGSGAPDRKEALASVTLHDADRRFLTARRSTEGNLLFEGQDLTRDEYEWALTIAPVDIDAVVSALDGRPGENVLDLLGAHGDDIWNCGESAWLQKYGIRADFWSWGTPPLP